MSTLASIKRLYHVIDSSVFMTTGNLDYGRITHAITVLANAVHEYKGDNDDLWYIGEFHSCCLADFIVGAYWHYGEWHGGQWSDSYAALSALGTVFDPCMTNIERDNEAYKALNDMAGG